MEETMSKKVLVIMGSDSDLPKLESCFAHLDQFEIEWEAAVCSAHRSPERAAELARDAAKNGFGVIIAAAGLAAHLPGVLAAYTILPVIGVPISAGSLNGLDALLAEVQMPAGIPVATVAIDGAANAAILAAQILALAEPRIANLLREHKESLAAAVADKDERLRSRLNER
jgi:5-(carboxyamino)imidazole ribonucleotide mutase